MHPIASPPSGNRSKSSCSVEIQHPASSFNEPADRVSQIESLATRRTIRCAFGETVWHTWGSGRPLVLLHGASGSWTHWIRNVLPLAQHFTVIVPDLPGFGDSDMPPEPHVAQTLVESVVLGLDALAPASAGIELAGFSFGGLIGGLAAARMGRGIRTVVLLGAGGLGLGRAPIPPLRRIKPGLIADEMRQAHRENLQLLMIANPEAIDDLAVHLQMENVRRARFRPGRIPTSTVLLQALPAIQARIAGIWGERDAFAAPKIDDRRKVLASIKRDLDFRVIAGAGHWVPYEAAQEVNAALLDMLLA